MLKKVQIICITIIALILLTQANNKAQANIVEYRGNTGLITTPNDFFLNLGELLPGDTKEDVAYIRNTTNESVEVFFKTEPINRQEYYDDIDYSLLEKLQLTITLKKANSIQEQQIYKGNLGANLMQNYISLGTYNNGYDGEFKFKIEVPTELKNDYSLSTTKVKWVFSVQKKSDEKMPNEEIPNENTNENNEDTNEKNPIRNIINTVKTGDKFYYLIALFVGLIVILVILLIKKFKNMKRQDDNDKNIKN